MEGGDLLLGRELSDESPQLSDSLLIKIPGDEPLKPPSISEHC